LNLWLFLSRWMYDSARIIGSYLLQYTSAVLSADMLMMRISNLKKNTSTNCLMNNGIWLSSCCCF
jgi:hypothetical protein